MIGSTKLRIKYFYVERLSEMRASLLLEESSVAILSFLVVSDDHLGSSYGIGRLT